MPSLQWLSWLPDRFFLEKNFSESFAQEREKLIILKKRKLLLFTYNQVDLDRGHKAIG